MSRKSGKKTSMLHTLDKILWTISNYRFAVNVEMFLLFLISL